MTVKAKPFPFWYYPAALALGAAAVAGFAPLGWYVVAIVSIGLLYAGLRRANTLRQAVLLGLLWGLGCFLTGVSWVYVSMHDVGGMPLPMAGTMTVLFCFYLSLFPALATGAAFLLRFHRTLDCLTFAAGWILAEWLRGMLFTGFPWLAVGYAHAGGSPLGGYAAILGVYGVGFFAVFASALLSNFAARPERGRVPIFVVTVLAIAGLVLDQVEWTRPHGKPFLVSLLQGNVPQSMKWSPDRLKLSMDTYASLVRQNPADLVVLPETAIPLMLDDIPKSYLKDLTAKQPILLGAAVMLDQKNYANAALLINSKLEHSAYYKRHLVPFGEFAPWGFGWFFKFINMPMSGFSAGIDKQPALAFGDTLISPNICYEDLFGEELLDALPNANLLINLSNTAWFGDSLAQPQHLQISQMRARETGRMMLRSTNTGMTAAIGPNGRIVSKMPPFVTGAVTVKVQGYAGSTPYAVWSNLPILVLVLGWLIAAWQRQQPAASV